jgi:hypothetical protein
VTCAAAHHELRLELCAARLLLVDQQLLLRDGQAALEDGRRIGLEADAKDRNDSGQALQQWQLLVVFRRQRLRSSNTGACQVRWRGDGAQPARQRTCHLASSCGTNSATALGSANALPAPLATAISASYTCRTFLR